MSERTFFSLRYAVPGYSFILVIAAINHQPLLKLIPTIGELFSIFLALLSGPALGFLISQIWFYLFKRDGGIFGIKELKPAWETLTKKCNVRLPDKANSYYHERVERLGTMLDFIFIEAANKPNEKIYEYAQRRWDMYHLIISTRNTLVLASATGIILRVYFEIFLFGAQFIPDIVHIFLFRTPFLIIPNINAIIIRNPYHCYNAVTSAETWALMIVFSYLIAIFWALQNAPRRIMTSYCPFLQCIIKKSSVHRADLKVFLENLGLS